MAASGAKMLSTNEETRVNHQGAFRLIWGEGGLSEHADNIIQLTSDLSEFDSQIQSSLMVSETGD